MTITRNNKEAWLELLWDAVIFYKEEGISCEGLSYDDVDYQPRVDEQDDLNTVMAWIREDLGLPDLMEVEMKKEEKAENNSLTEFQLCARSEHSITIKASDLEDAIDEANTTPLGHWSLDHMKVEQQS